MKRVLITGANSFLGNSTKQYLEKYGDYKIDVLDMLNPCWEETDFSVYDTVFNVCAIVHRPNEKDADLYFKINRDLAVKIAKKAKKSGVKQFVQTSTNGVFGINLGIMTVETSYKPKSHYEKSKYEADCLLETLRDNKFKVCIIRPPLIYGNGCKGNFPKLEKYALSKSYFPSFKNKKDFIYVENLADFVKFAIDNNLDEICYPRDKKVASTSQMIELIARYNNHKMKLLSVFNPFVKVFFRLNRVLTIIFGDCYFEGAVSSGQWVPPFSLEDAIKRMYEGKDNT